MAGLAGGARVRAGKGYEYRTGGAGGAWPPAALRAERAERPAVRTLAIRIAVSAFLMAFAAGLLRPAALHAQSIRTYDSSVTVNENGGAYQQRVWLNRQPTSDVTVTIVSGDETVATVHPTTLTFTPSDYQTKQVVTYRAVDDNVSNVPQRQTKITLTASGGGYDGVSHVTTVKLADDEGVHFILDEGQTYRFPMRWIVGAGCPATMSLESSDTSVLTVDPPTLTWTEAESGATKYMFVRVRENDEREEGMATIRRSMHEPPCSPLTVPDIVITVRDNDAVPTLSVEALPACGTTVTNTSVQPQVGFVLKPAPAVEKATEYRPIFEGNSEPWRGSLPIRTSGRSIFFHHTHLSSLRQAFPGFKGFEYRLKDDHAVTARCTWQFKDDDDRGGGGSPTTPTVSLFAAPNPVAEGAPVTVTARLSVPMSSEVTVPVTVEAGTAEAGDHGTMAGINIASGSMSGTGMITTAQDADTDDETFTVSLGSMPSSITAGNPSSVTVTIDDDDGGGDDSGGGGTPTNRPPTVTASCDPCTVAPGGQVRLRAVASDPDGDALTYAWGAPLGGFTGAAGGASARWRAPPDPGTVVIRVRVSDGRGGTASATVTVHVVNAPPVFGAPAYTFRLREGVPGRVDLGSVSAQDPEGAVVTYALVTGGDDRFEVDARSGVVAYTGPGEDYETEPNRYEMTVRARDPLGAEARARVTVLVTNVNEGPEAVADAARTPEDTEIVIDVLANDSDVEGDALTVVAATEPSHGTARIATGGGVIYAPEADWHGTDAFAYTVSDGNGGTATADVEVVVEPVNDAPVAVADTARTPEDIEVEIGVLANDSDVEGDALTVAAVTAPLHGTARIATGGGVIYAPGADWHGTDAFVYTVSDGNGGTATAEVEVVVDPVNDAPVAVADTARALEDTDVEIGVLANDSDVEGDALTVAAVTAPSHGTAQIATGGGVIYAPHADWHGTDAFAYTVTDGNGGTATAEVVVVVEPVNDAPVPVGEIPEQSLDEGGAAAAFDLTPYFEDPDGDPLTYAAASSDPGVAAVAVAGSMLTVTPVGYGEATVEVTARDPGGLMGHQAFQVNASDRLARLVLDETLAAMARAHLASARMTLGRRVGPGAGTESGSMLTVMGRRVPLGRDAAREAAGQLLESWAVSRLPGGRGLGVPGGGTEWVFAFGGQEGHARPGGAWRFWGQGDIQTFAGEPAAERGYEGDLRTGWAGLDRALGQRWLVGLAVARSRGVGDWRAASAGGRLETSLTAVHPYLRWSDGATSLWAMAGGGRGSAENTRGPRAEWGPAPPLHATRVGTSGLDLRLGLFEARRRFTDWLGLRADAAWARLATGAGDETVDGRSATVDQQRLGIELTPSTRLGGLAIEPFAEASARRDGGTGQTGSGLEVAGGLRTASGPVRIVARGRILVLHSAQGYEERGLGVTLTVGSPAAEEGLSLSVSPRWGGPASATGALWNEALPGRTPHGGGASEAWSLDAATRYAIRLPGGRFLTWSGNLDRSARGYALTIGGELLGSGAPAGRTLRVRGPALDALAPRR